MIGLATPAETYISLWHVSKFIDWRTTAISLTVCALFSLGCWTAFLTQGRRNAVPRGHVALDGLSTSGVWTLRRAYYWALALTAVGYVSFAVASVQRGFSPAIILTLLQHGGSDQIKAEALKTIPGLTTCTQFGIAAAILGSLVGRFWGWRRTAKSLSCLVLVTAVRAVVASERLALLEVVIPIIVVYVPDLLSRSRSVWTRGVRQLPWAAPAAIYLFFAVSEYFRSWSSAYSSGGGSIWAFSAARITGYYLTSVNNSAFFLDRFSPGAVPLFTGEWLWRFPFIATAFPGVADAANASLFEFGELLRSGANAEFNNPGGLFAPLLDFGIQGGLAVWFVLGFMARQAFNGFVRDRVVGLLLYPIVFVSILESPRVFYALSGRTFPAFVLLAFVASRAYAARRIKFSSNAYHPRSLGSGGVISKSTTHATNR